jgi:hypothetical protein
LVEVTVVPGSVTVVVEVGPETVSIVALVTVTVVVEVIVGPDVTVRVVGEVNAKV